MTKLIAYADVEGGQCWARFRISNNDPCWLGIAQSGVLVKKSVLGIFGAQLYKEKDIYYAGNTARVLTEKYQDDLTPAGMKNPVLKAFTNAILHCSDLPEIIHTLNTAFPRHP